MVILQKLVVRLQVLWLSARSALPGQQWRAQVGAGLKSLRYACDVKFCSGYCALIPFSLSLCRHSQPVSSRQRADAISCNFLILARGLKLRADRVI